MPPSKKRRLKCCVPHCESVEPLFGEEDNGLKLYKFPTDKPLMKKWVAQVGRGPNFIPTEKTRICSKHFQTGRKSYKPSHADYVPNIFWYNTIKNSEFCSGCRRKLCKCDTANESTAQKTAGVSSSQHEFNEKEMLQLLETIEAETVELDAEDFSHVELLEQTESADSAHVSTSTGTSFLAVDEGTLPPSLLELPSNISNPKDSTQISINREVNYVLETRTHYDDIIDCCVRGEDSVGDDILLRQFRKTAVIDLQEEEVNADINKVRTQPELFSLTTVNAPLSCSVTFDVSQHNSLGIVTTEDIPKIIVENATHANNDSCAVEIEVIDPNSDLEIEWKRRERRLTKQHKIQEKKLVLEIIRNNQAKNLSIEELKREIKQLKKNEKDRHTLTTELERTIRAEYEVIRKADIKSVVDEANSNLTLLQSQWTEEKRVLMEANSALAKICNGEVDHLNDIQAEFMCSVIASCSTPQAGVVNLQGPLLETTSIPLQPTLRFESCSNSDETLKYFTGIPTVADFNTFYALLEPNAKTMSYWNGKSWWVNSSVTKKFKSGRIDLKNRLFLTLTRYRRGFTTKELGFFFNCDPTYISCLFITFSKLIENDLVSLFLRDYNYPNEFATLPEIVQTHYTKLYGTLRLVEIRLENQPAPISGKTVKSPPGYKLLFMCSPNGNILFISSAFLSTTSDRDVILGSKVLDGIPEGSEIFVEQQFDVGEECVAKQLQLLVFPQELTPSTLSEDDPWEIKLLTKCKCRIEKLVGFLRYFGIFDKGTHLIGSKNHAATIIRVVLLLQHYIDTYCTPPEPSPQSRLLTAVLTL